MKAATSPTTPAVKTPAFDEKATPSADAPDVPPDWDGAAVVPDALWLRVEDPPLVVVDAPEVADEAPLEVVDVAEAVEGIDAAVEVVELAVTPFWAPRASAFAWNVWHAVASSASFVFKQLSNRTSSSGSYRAKETKEGTNKTAPR